MKLRIPVLLAVLALFGCSNHINAIAAENAAVNYNRLATLVQQIKASSSIEDALWNLYEKSRHYNSPQPDNAFAYFEALQQIVNQNDNQTRVFISKSVIPNQQKFKRFFEDLQNASLRFSLIPEADCHNNYRNIYNKLRPIWADAVRADDVALAQYGDDYPLKSGIEQWGNEFTFRTKCQRTLDAWRSITPEMVQNLAEKLELHEASEAEME